MDLSVAPTQTERRAINFGSIVDNLACFVVEVPLLGFAVFFAHVQDNGIANVVVASALRIQLVLTARVEAVEWAVCKNNG